MCMRMYVYACVCVSTRVCMRMYVCLCVCMCVCMEMNVYICEVDVCGTDGEGTSR